MSDEDARRDLADLIEDHLSRRGQSVPKLSALAFGLVQIETVLHEAQERRGNWADMRRRLVDARSTIEAALGLPDALDAGLERLVRIRSEFARLVISEIERLQAHETTLV